MGVSVVLRPATLTVDPGRDARCRVSIRNNSQVVDQFHVTVVGDVNGWTEVRPAVVNLLPNEEGIVELLFAPPRSSEVLAGDHHFALKIASREDPAGSVVQEGTTTVTEFAEMAADVVPQTSEGRRKGKHALAIDNTGNHPVLVDVAAADPDNKLTFTLRPRTPRTHPGTTMFVRVKARPKKYMWKGANRPIPFHLTAIPEVGAAIEVDATLVQKPMLPRRLMLVLLALLILLLLLLMWLSRLMQDRPVSAAGTAPLLPPSSTVTRTPTLVPVATTPPRPPPTQVPVRQNPPVRNRPPASPAPLRSDFTISAVAFPGVAKPQLFSYVVPVGRTLRLSSVVFDESEDDAGIARVHVNDEVVATIDLAGLKDRTIQERTVRFDPLPTVTEGKQVTVAIECGVPSGTCTLIASFAAAIVPRPR